MKPRLERRAFGRQRGYLEESFLMLLDFSDRNYIVTGGNGGIGRAIVKGILEGGGRVAAIDLVGSALEELLTAFPDRVLFLQADLSQKTALRETFRKIIGQFKKIHGLVNCAGVVHTKPLTEIQDGEWEQVLRINLDAVFIGIQEVFPVMAAEHYGRIVNIGSVAGKVGGGLFGTSAYAVSKAGVMCLTKAVAKEGAPYGISCNCVNPGYIRTQLTGALDGEKQERVISSCLLRRGGLPEEAASLALFYLSDLASYITGEIGDVDGGLTLD